MFRIIEDLVLWENTTNETVLQQARDEIWQIWRYTYAENADHPRAKELFDRHKLPAFHDPFAGGGGAPPLEAQRLGLESCSSDLNPVAVLINKPMIEIPSKFAGKPPVNPEARKKETIAFQAMPEWRPDVEISGSTQYLGVKPYGVKQFSQLSTERQLVALTTFSDLVREVGELVKRDALNAILPNDDKPLAAGSTGAIAYADAVRVYLGLVDSSLADRMSTICTWDAGDATWGTKTRNTFSRQAIKMTWDFAEVNPLSGQSGSWSNSLDYSAKGVEVLCRTRRPEAKVNLCLMRCSIWHPTRMRCLYGQCARVPKKICDANHWHGSQAF